MTLEIIQTWKTNGSLPPIFEQSMATWIAHHPAARHRLVDDEYVWGWLDEHRRAFPHAVSGGEQQPIRTVDLFRYCHLLVHGGLYVDLDFHCLRPVDDILNSCHDAVCLGSVVMPRPAASAKAGDPRSWLYRNSIPNAWMYSPAPGHPFWLVVIALAEERRSDLWVERATGPMLVFDALETYRTCRSGGDLGEIPGVRRIADACHVRIPDDLPPVFVLRPEVLYPLTWASSHHQSIIGQFTTADRIDETLMGQVPVTEKTRAFTYWYGSWRRDTPRP
jgi:hypothetical protein